MLLQHCEIPQPLDACFASASGMASTSEAAAGELPDEEGEAAPDPEDDIIPMAEDHFEVGSATDASYYLKYIKHDFRPWRKYGIPRVSHTSPSPLLSSCPAAWHGFRQLPGAKADIGAHPGVFLGKIHDQHRPICGQGDLASSPQSKQV